MRNGFRLRLLAGLLIAGWIMPPASAAVSAREITGRMQRTMDTVRSLSASFALTSHYGAVDRSGTSTGRLLLLKEQNKLRLEQNDQVIVSDGASVWTYVPENKQIIVSPASRQEGGMRPDEFFFYYIKHYTPALIGREIQDGVVHYVLKLKARDETAELQELRVWVDSRRWLTRKVVYTDDMGTTTTIRFSDIRLNPSLPDTMFVMPIPDGVEVVDLR